MLRRTTKVKVVKISGSTVTVRLVSLNRNMPVKKEDFMERLESGDYEVLNLAQFPELQNVEVEGD